MSIELKLDNNNVLELQSLTNSVTAAADTAATVEVTIQDRNGNPINGQVWPASMPHIAAGTYRVTLDADLVMDRNKTYVAVIDAVGSGGEIGHWEVPVRAVTRTS